MEISHRRLPHERPENATPFVTWCLDGALPECRYPPPNHPSAGAAFVWMDRHLDTTRTGPMWLRQEAVADLIAAHIREGAETERWYQLFAWAVMANHVHLLAKPLIDASDLLRRLKGRTAREANKLLGRTGKPFWQAESYDHWVRNREEMARITRYIENNPVAAGLAAIPEQWSSAYRRGGAGFSLQRGL